MSLHVDHKLVGEVMFHFFQGDRLFFGTDPLDNAEINIKHGPFKIFTKRRLANPETFSVINDQITWVHENE